MKTTFEEKDGKYIMHFEGRLDTASSVQTEQEMKVLHDCEGHDIVLDCEKLDYISSSGLRLFLTLLQECHTTGNTVTITGLSPYIHRVFDETGFTRMFKLQPAEDTNKEAV